MSLIPNKVISGLTFALQVYPRVAQVVNGTRNGHLRSKDYAERTLLHSINITCARQTGTAESVLGSELQSVLGTLLFISFLGSRY